MSKQFIIKGVLFLLTAFCISFKSFNTLKLAGGPPYNSGGPGETTCSSQSGTNVCHSGGIADNAGPANKSITVSGGAQYIPGQTYTVTVTINHPSRNKFGFQIISLINGSNANAGSVVLTDAVRTWSQFPGYGPYQTRRYVMHNINGTPGIANQGQWSYNWTAPSSNVGPITFYAACLAANNNGLSDSGDEVYTTSLTITPGTVGLKSILKNFAHLSVYPNPTKNNLNIDYTLEETADLKVKLTDVSGKLIQELIDREQSPGTYKENFNLNKDVSPGTYFIEFTANNKKIVNKVIIE